MLPGDSGTTIFLATFPSEKHRTIGEVSKLKGSRFLHFTMEIIWSSLKIYLVKSWKNIRGRALPPGLGTYLCWAVWGYLAVALGS